MPEAELLFIHSQLELSNDHLNKPAPGDAGSTLSIGIDTCADASVR